MMAALLSLSVLSALWACGSVTNELGDGGGASGAGSGGGDASVSGLPCEVADLLAAQCVSCHSDPPRNAAPMAMVSYDDLAAPSLSDPSRTVAEMSVVRMHDATASMPPGGQLSVGAIAPFEAWVADGMPRGDCATGGETVVCSSGETWIWDDEPPDENRRPEMNPGMACNSCHMAENEGPNFGVAGTVYPTFHEPDICFGAEEVTVEVTDAVGRVIA